ncbi:MAG: hypothetical protein M3Q86_09765, partial [Verrucomicrobiota bacterium]|nr:hypothetical protein [Verrucomicrobiota bacterium]
MKTFQDSGRPVASGLFCLTIALLLLTGCRKAPDDRVQGYVEGEFVYVSSPLAGTVEKLAVQRGQQVAAAAPLFALDGTMELAARDQDRQRLTQSEWNLAQMKQDAPQAGLVYDTLFRQGEWVA